VSAQHFSLDQFTGPLDLLLHLVRRNEMDIFDLDLAAITEQYLDFIEREGVRDLAGAYHFLAMAASLVELKSRMLLPQPPKAEGEEGAEDEAEADPRLELSRKLAAYQGIQDVTAELARRFHLTGRQWPRQVVEKLEAEIVYNLDSVSVYDLMTAFSDVMARPHFRQITIFREDYDIDEARGWLRARMRSGPCEITAILMEQPDVVALITTFIALLDLIKDEELNFSRDDQGAIVITLVENDATSIL
jgi:segregation and condensation protein A